MTFTHTEMMTESFPPMTREELALDFFKDLSQSRLNMGLAVESIHHSPEGVLAVAFDLADKVIAKREPEPEEPTE